MQNFLEIIENLSQSLDKILPDLRAVIHDHEEDFLHLGQEIFAVNEKSRSLAQKGAELVQLTGGEQIESAVDSFQRHLQAAHSLFALDALETSLDKMDSIHGSIRTLGAMVRDFRRLTRTLQVLGISTRIESARLGNAGRGFITLADDVESLAAKIAAHAKKIHSECRSLLLRMDQARTTTREILSDQTGLAGTFVTRLEENIQDMNSLRASSARQSTALQEKSARLAREMGEIVVSVQFHDITRQKVEHVVEVLEHCVDLLKNFKEQQGKEDEAKNIIALVMDLADLQLSQLRHANETFQQAVNTLLTNLTSIGKQVENLYENSGDQDHGSHNDQSSLLARARENVNSLLESMTESSKRAQVIGESMKMVASTVNEMVGLAEDIEEIGSEIELIALNASVRAAHTGEEGRAMGVLAVAIQKLSGDARELTDSATASLKDVSDNSDSLFQITSEVTNLSQIKGMTSSFNTLFQQLQNMDQDISRIFSRMASSGRELEIRVSDLVHGTSFHHQVDSKIQDMQSQIAKVMESVRENLPTMDPETVRKNAVLIQNLLAKYTMDSERIIHEEMFGNIDGKSEEPEIFESGQDQTRGFEVELFDDVDNDENTSDLGDNVELF